MTDFFAGLLGEWSQTINIYSILFKTLLAMVFSTVIGVERATKRHDAGLRTFMVIALLCTTAGIVDKYIITNSDATASFVSAAAVLGIATISGNTILFSSKSQIKGLTTSVAMWATGLICVALGFGLYTVAVVSFVAVLVALMIFPRIEKAYKSKSRCFELHLELKSRESLPVFATAVRKLGLTINDIELNPAYNATGLSVYSVLIFINDKKLLKNGHAEIIDALSSLDCVSYVEEIF